MASSAIYSEIIELVLTTDKYEQNIGRAIDSLLNVSKTANALRKEFDALWTNNDWYFKSLSGAEELIKKQDELIRQTKLMNDIRKEAEHNVHGTLSTDETKNLTKQIEVQKSALAIEEARVLVAKQKAAIDKSDTMSLIAMDYKKEHDAAIAQVKVRQEELVATELIQKAIKEINTIDDAELRTLQKQLETRRLLVAQEGLAKTVEQSTLAIENKKTEQLRKQQVASKVGDILSGSTVGSAMAGLSSVGFMVGGGEIGAATFMLERMSYAMGIGKVKMTELISQFPLLSSAVNGAKGVLGLFGESMLAFGGTIAAIAAPIGLMFAGNSLDNAIASMSTLLASASTEGNKFAVMMNSAASAAAKLSESFGMNLVDTVKGFKTALSTGINADQLEEFGTIAATVAKGLGTSFDDAVNILTTFKDAYGFNMKEIASASDVLFNAINVGKFQVDDLKQNIGRVAVSASEAGVGLQDMMAGLTVLSRVGLSTSQSITSLNRMIGGIISPTAAAKKEFEALGLATGMAAFKTQTLMEYMAQLKAVTGGDAEIIAKLFHTEQGRRGALGITTNPDLAKEAVAEMADVGTATVAANRAMDTFSQNFEKIFQAVWDVAQEIGRDLLQAANAVFFPDGPLGTANMFSIKSALETLGIAIKIVGQVIIGVGGVAYHIFNVMLAGITSVGLALSGDITGAWDRFTSAAISGGKGVVNIFDGMAKSLNETARRMVELTNGTAKVNEEGVKPLKDNVAELIPLFSDGMVKALDAMEKKGKSAFGVLAEEAHKARLAMDVTKFDSTYKDPDFLANSHKVTDNDDLIKEAKRKLAIGRSITNDNTGYDSVLDASTLTISKEELTKRIVAAGGYDPDDPTTMQRINALRAAAIRIAEQDEDTLAKARAEARKAAKRKYLLENGYDKKEVDELVPTGVDNKTPDDIKSSILKHIEDTSKALDALVEKGEASITTAIGFHGSSGGISTSTRKTSDPSEVLSEAKRLYDTEYSYYMTNKEKMSKEDTAREDAYFEMMASNIDKLANKNDEAVAKQYKKEFDQAQKIFNLKTGFFQKEADNAQKLISQYDDLLTKMSLKDTERMGTIRGPEWEYRSTRQQIETGITKASSMDSKDAYKAIEDLNKLIDKMVSSGTSAGYGTRANIQANEYSASIKDIVNDKKMDLTKDKAAAENNITNAIAAFQRDMASNPVAQAALAQAMVVMKEVVQTAAKNGIGVAGDLKQAVDVGGVNVNIDLNQFRDLIKAAAETTVQDYLRGKTKGRTDNAYGTANYNPTGAPSDNSSDTQYQWNGASVNDNLQ